MSASNWDVCPCCKAAAIAKQAKLLIQANRDQIHKMFEGAERRVRRCLETAEATSEWGSRAEDAWGHVENALAVLNALKLKYATAAGRAGGTCLDCRTVS